MTKASEPATVDEYIATAPEQTRVALQTVRDAIRRAAPDAEERISYGMPYYFRNGRLAYFNVQARHIGLYPITKEDVEGTSLSGYASSKATVRIPLGSAIVADDIVTAVRRRAARLEPSPEHSR